MKKQPDEPDLESPEWSDEEFKNAKRLDDLPSLAAKVRRGRPLSENRKVALKLRIDPDIVERFKEGGPGYQSRMNDALREWLDTR